MKLRHFVNNLRTYDIDKLDTGDIVFYVHDHMIEEGKKPYLIENVYMSYLHSYYTHVGLVYRNGIVTSHRRPHYDLLTRRNKTGLMWLPIDSVLDYPGYVFVYKHEGDISKDINFDDFDKEWDANSETILVKYFSGISQYETNVCSEIVANKLTELGVMAKKSHFLYSLKDIEDFAKSSSKYDGPYLIENKYSHIR